MKKLAALFFTGILLTGCLKEELPVKKPGNQVAGAFTENLAIGSDYKNQLYYSLENQETVLLANREDWDLGFEASADGFRVIINNGRFGGIKLLAATSFADVTTDNSSDLIYDAPSGNLDSTAIGDWRNKDNIYLFNLGNSIAGTSLGKYKLRIVSVTPTEYTIEYCKLNETTPVQGTITKEPAYSFSTFSLRTGQQVTATTLPKKSTYDFCIRTYTHIFSDGMPYLVMGAVMNFENTTAVKLYNTDFASFTYLNALSQEFKTNIDAIGYDWKTYNFDNSTYTVDPKTIFVLKTQNGRYFKFHFLDFYDEFGVKGAPKMEAIELVE